MAWKHEMRFIEALARHLRGRGRVLEVGAGNGLLALELKEQGVNIVATDLYSIHGPIAVGITVEELDYRVAIQKHKPSIILCSWMPYQKDWTPAFRAREDLLEYILVGYPDGCGTIDGWQTHPGFTRLDFKTIADPKFSRVSPGGGKDEKVELFIREQMVHP